MTNNLIKFKFIGAFNYLKCVNCYLTLNLNSIK